VGAKVTSQDYELVSVADLAPHPENPNQGDVGAIVGSIEANGLFGALVVQRPKGSRKRGRILAGNHRWLAAKHAGIPEVPVVWVDVDDDRALRIMLADNESARRASYDGPQLADLLAQLAHSDEGFAGAVFDGDDLDDLLAQLGTAPDLDGLADQLGIGGADDDDVDPDDWTRTVRLTLSLEVFGRWNTYVNGEHDGDDKAAFAALLDCVDR
jgi:hypothetical protein